MNASLARYRVKSTPGAKQDLIEMKAYLAERSSHEAAIRSLMRLRDFPAFSAELAYAPVRGRSLESIRPGMRVIGFEHRVAIVFAVFDDEWLVEIEGFDFGGRQKATVGLDR